MIDSDKIPHFIKYMGAKREILGYIHSSIQELNVDSTNLCDLFSGTSVVAASFSDEYNIHANDIQQYSSVFSNTYLHNISRLWTESTLNEIEFKVRNLVDEFTLKFPQYNFSYSNITSYDDLSRIEKLQQELINVDFGIGFNIFVKCYSGTYWSYEQCVWIDSIRAIAEEYKGTEIYYAMLSALIFSMSYSSQSTGHFAQFRDITESNTNDILIYRVKDIWKLFSKKLLEIVEVLNVDPIRNHKITSLDYVDCLRIIEPNTIVYADPPYSNVHYSRFYHVIETLVRYDHPTVKYKGRYRDDRHQSPFDKRKEVRNAFRIMFENIKNRESHLVLSYSNNGMISQDEIIEISNSVFGLAYSYDVKSKKYSHSKMGRSDEHRMDVKELLISYKKL